MLRRKVSLLCLFMMSAWFSCASKQSSYVLASPPAWYKAAVKRPFVDVEMLMKKGFTRLEALELQRSALDDVKSKSVSFQEALDEAMSDFKRGKPGKSGFLPLENLQKGDFIVAFDLDETMLVQWNKMLDEDEKYRDICTGVSDTNFTEDLVSSKCVKFVPGWERMFKRLSALSGFRGVVFYSAKDDKATDAIVDSWIYEGKPVRSFILGSFSRSYLTKGEKVFLASKDLRIIDESLEHVIMIDDNPSRLFQARNVRVFPKYNGDNYLKAKYQTNDQKVLSYYELLMDEVFEEIMNSAEYAKGANVGFVEAFYPFSQAGAYCTRMIQDTLGYSKKRAADFYRANPDLCRDVFYGVPTNAKR